MAKPQYVITPLTGELLRSVAIDLSRVRQWIEGFEAAGGKGPPHADCLRWAQIMLSDAKALPASDDDETTGNTLETEHGNG